MIDDWISPIYNRYIYSFSIFYVLDWFNLMSPQTIPLSDLTVGTHALISKMGDDPHLCYLRCMGFCPGAHVELIRRISGGALSVYRVDDADVALRQATAALISVRMEG